MDEPQDLLGDITEEEFALLRCGNHRYEDEGKIYHMAIIDYLQTYNCPTHGIHAPWPRNTPFSPYHLHRHGCARNNTGNHTPAKNYT